MVSYFIFSLSFFVFVLFFCLTEILENTDGFKCSAHGCHASVIATPGVKFVKKINPIKPSPLKLYCLIDLTKTFNGLILVELEQSIVSIKLSGSILLWYGWFFVSDFLDELYNSTVSSLDSRHGVYKCVSRAYH